MMRNFFYAGLFCFAALLCVCDSGKKDVCATVGSAQISTLDFAVVSAIDRFYPSVHDTFKLAHSDPVYNTIATEALYQSNRWNPGNIRLWFSKDWKVKKMFYLAQVYELDILQRNCGYTDAELNAYYESHKNDFKRATVNVQNGAPCTTLVLQPFDSIHAAVAGKMFLEKFVYDSTTFNLKNPSLFEAFRENDYKNYFMKKFYKAKYGTKLPDHLIDVLKQPGLIDTSELAVVFSWQSLQNQTGLRKDPQMMIRAYLQWKLFCENAKISGYADGTVAKSILSWAWKTEVVKHALQKRMSPMPEKSLGIDTAMVRFAYMDAHSGAGDSAGFREFIAQTILTKKTEIIDSIAYKACCDHTVRIVKKDIPDDNFRNPAQLLHNADSLRDAGNIAQAQGQYNLLVSHFVFTKEGKTALVELAKILIEQESYGDAIANYRHFLEFNADPAKRSGIMFAIGFLYANNFQRPDLAEANLKWILRNYPSFESIADVESLLQHLGEPMTCIEDIQAEARRQGRNIDSGMVVK